MFNFKFLLDIFQLLPEIITIKFYLIFLKNILRIPTREKLQAFIDHFAYIVATRRDVPSKQHVIKSNLELNVK